MNRAGSGRNGWKWENRGKLGLSVRKNREKRAGRREWAGKAAKMGVKMGIRKGGKRGRKRRHGEFPLPVSLPSGSPGPSVSSPVSVPLTDPSRPAKYNSGYFSYHSHHEYFSHWPPFRPVSPVSPPPRIVSRLSPPPFFFLLSSHAFFSFPPFFPRFFSSRLLSSRAFLYTGWWDPAGSAGITSFSFPPVFRYRKRFPRSRTTNSRKV